MPCSMTDLSTSAEPCGAFHHCVVIISGSAPGVYTTTKSLRGGGPVPLIVGEDHVPYAH